MDGYLIEISEEQRSLILSLIRRELQVETDPIVVAELSELEKLVD